MIRNDGSFYIRSFDHAPTFLEACEDAGICPICGRDLLDCICGLDDDLEGEARAFEARREPEAIDFAMNVHLEAPPAAELEPETVPVVVSTPEATWRPTSDPALCWRWVRAPGGIVVESRRGKLTTRCSPAAVNEAAFYGNRDAVNVQRAIGGAA